MALLRGGQLRRSAEESEAALAIAREGRFHVNLGAALYELRDFVGAIRNFEAAVEIDGDDLTAHLNLANALSEVRGL